MKHLAPLLFIPALIVIFDGCATDIQKLNTFAHYYYDLSPKKAHHFALKQDKENQDLLWTMQAGISGYTAGLDSAGSLLDKSEALFNTFEAEGIIASSAAKIGATLVNDNVMDYRGNIYEGVFINYYKALYYLQNSKYQEARVEFNRANDRQRRAKEYYTKQVKQVKQNEQERYDNSDAKKLVKENQTISQVDSILLSKYSNLYNFRAFDGFINPVVSYISGLFFLLEGDNKGLDYLKEAYGISQAPLIAQDMLYFSNSTKDPYTWILLEEGRQAHKTELEFSLPLITFDGVYHFGIALPQINNGTSFNRTYYARFSSDSYIFDEIINTDKIIATEFEKQLTAITIRAITSATLKLIAQLGISKGVGQANEIAGLFASIVGSIYSMATTNADLRIASVLPHTILLARFPSRQGIITIYADNKPLTTIQIKDCATSQPDVMGICSNQNNLLYIRQTHNQVFTKILFRR